MASENIPADDIPPDSLRATLGSMLASDRAKAAAATKTLVDATLALLVPNEGSLATLIRHLEEREQRSMAVFADTLETLREMSLGRANPLTLVTLNEHLGRVNAAMHQVADDTPQIHPRDFPKHFSQQSSRMLQNAEEVVKDAEPLIGALAASLVLDHERLDGALRAQRDAVRSEVEQIRGMAQSAKLLLDGARESVQAATLSEHARVFSEEASSFDLRAWWWFTASLALFLITGALAWENLKHAEVASHPLQVSTVVQVLAAKLFFAALLVAGIRAALSQYRAARHNSVINQHRSRALQSFNALVQATPDPQTRAAVLLQATNGIFSPQPTGYLGRDFEQVASPPTVAEAIRAASSKDAVGA